MTFELHFQTDKTAAAAATIHVAGCRHNRLRPVAVSALSGSTKQDAMRDAQIDDLLGRGFGISFAPCTKEAM